MMLRVTAIAFLIRAIPLCCWSAPITGHPYSHEFGKVAFKYAYGAHSKHVDCIKSWSSFFAQSMPFEQSLTDVQVLTAGGHQAFIGVTRGEVQLSAAASTPQLGNAALMRDMHACPNVSCLPQSWFRSVAMARLATFSSTTNRCRSKQRIPTGPTPTRV